MRSEERADLGYQLVVIAGKCRSCFLLFSTQPPHQPYYFANMAQYTPQRKVPTVQEFREIEKQRERASLGNDSDLAASEQAETAPSAPSAPSAPTASSALTDSSGGAAPPVAVPDREASLRQRKNAGAAEDPDDDDDAPEDGDYGEQSGQAEKERLKQQSQPQGKPTDFKEKGKR